MSSLTSNSAKSNQYKKPRSFAEALLELGNQNPPAAHQAEQSDSPDTTDNGKRIEHDWKQQLRLERHKELTQTPVFDREKEEIAKQIKEIQEELKKLAQELAFLGTEVDQAISQAVVNPGKYHLSFFEALRRLIIHLRKKTSDAGHWLALSQQRKAAQNHYWSSVKKAGTSFMLSSERTLQTQSG